MLQKKLVVILILGLLVLGSISVSQVKAFPGDKPAIVVEPTSISNPSLIPGSTFLVNISLYNATADIVPAGIGGIEVHLAWNNSVLQPLSFVDYLGQPGGVLTGPQSSLLFGIPANFFNSTGGKVILPPYTNATNFAVSAASTNGPWSGNGLVATINFTVISVGTSQLSLTFTDLTDAFANEVDHYAQDSSFSNVAPPTQPSPAVIYVNPPSVINSSMTPPNSFSVNLNVINATNLASFAFSLNFNATVLQVTSTTWSWNGSAAGFTIDNTLGTVTGITTINPPITGNVSLVGLIFSVSNLGETPIHIVTVTLIDNHGFTVSTTTIDGYFNNMLITSIYVDPPFRMDPNLHLTNMTTFGIIGVNFEDVRSCQFDLRYNPKVLRLMSYVVINPIGGSFIDYQNIAFNNTLGDFSAMFTYDTPVSVATSPLVNVTFMEIGYGSSPLNLNSSAITDPSGNLISHSTTDGLLITVVRDVAVTGIQASPLKLYAGRIVTMNVTVMNDGNLLNETFNVTAYVDTNVTIGTQTVTALPNGSSVTLTFYWDTTGQPQCSKHTLSGVASFVPYEANTTNNVLVSSSQITIKILGDINGDGKVDLTDLVILAQAYNSKVGDINYNSEADFNNDGKVNLIDLVTLAVHYGQSCPP